MSLYSKQVTPLQMSKLFQILNSRGNINEHEVTGGHVSAAYILPLLPHQSCSSLPLQQLPHPWWMGLYIGGGQSVHVQGHM